MIYQKYRVILKKDMTDILEAHKDWFAKQWAEINDYVHGAVIARVRAPATTEQRKFVFTADDFQMYSKVYSLVVALNTLSRGPLLRGTISEAVGEREVYQRLRDIVINFFKDWADRVSVISDGEILANISVLWNEYVMLREALSCLFRYLDQHYTKRSNATQPPLRKMCQTVFQDVFYTPLRERVHCVIVEAVMSKRGKAAEEVLESKILLYPAVQLVHTMSDYTSSLETKYLKSIVEQCELNALKWQSSDMASYMKNVERFMDDEANVVMQCLGIPETTKKVVAHMRVELLAKQRDVILSHPTCGVSAAIAHDIDTLTRLYKLYNYDPVAVTNIATEFKRHVQLSVQRMVDISGIVLEIDKLFQSLKVVVTSACGSSHEILSAVTTGLKESVPVSLPHFDQLLLVALDSAIRKPETGIPLSVAKLAPFVGPSLSKFRSCYMMDLARRHLCRVPVKQVVEREMSILQDMKAAVGPGHSRNIHTMLTDIARRETAEGVRFLNGAIWYSLTSVELKYKPIAAVSAAFERFGKAYLEAPENKGRCLRWSLTYGMSELTMKHAKYSDGIKVTCSNPQMTILAVMQHKHWVIRDLLCALEMTETDFKPLLMTLTQCGLVIEADGTVYVNTEWDPKTMKVVLPQLFIVAKPNITTTQMVVHRDPMTNLQ